MLRQPIFGALRSVRPALPPWPQPQARASPLKPRPSRMYGTFALRPFSQFFSHIPPQQTNLGPRLWPTYQSSPARIVFPTFRFVNRPFSSGPRHHYQQNRYNRFGRGGGQSLFYQLLQRAKPQHFVIIGVGISGVYLYNTDVVEMTGRRRFNCISSQQELKMGRESYREVLNSERGKILPDHHPLTQMVDRVLQRLIPQAPIEGANWKVHVIKDRTANAFVLPGGKVFVYTGILPICQDEDGLAAVLGHEIAHVVAHHPAERMSNSVLTLGAVFLVSLLFDVSGQLPSLLLNLMWSLPNSRTQELTTFKAEADNMGLMMMSKACFNPEAAVKLWVRMQKQEKEAPPQFMSTHPSSYNREEALRGWLAKAETIYADNGCSSLASYVPGFHNSYQSLSPSSW